MHSSGILTLSEAALAKRWGSRRTLGRKVKAGILPHRVIGRATLTTVEHLNSLKKPKER